MKLTTFLVQFAVSFGLVEAFSSSSLVPATVVHPATAKSSVLCITSVGPVRGGAFGTKTGNGSVVVASSSATTDGDGEWTKKRLHNTPLFRSAAILIAIVAGGLSSKSPLTALPKATSATLHVLAFGTWFGSLVYTTFVLGITMFKNLPRRTFGQIQGKLFPKYFALSSITLALQLVTLPSLTSVTVGQKSQRAIVTALAMTLANQFYLEPKTTANMLERHQLEDTPGGNQSEKYKQLKASFGKWHGISSLVNLIALCAGVAHAIYLASALV